MSEDGLVPRYAIGDIHGCYDALIALCDSVPLKSDDVVITLGDYVDNGPDSRKVLDWLIDRTAQNLCIPLRGNHEVMMRGVIQGTLRIESWLANGANSTLTSYLADGVQTNDEAGCVELIPQSHREFLLRNLQLYHETGSNIFVHAGARPERSMPDQDEHDCCWMKLDELRPHCSGKKIICGHNVQSDGYPLNHFFVTCIDTGVYRPDGWLTCLEIETGQYWQANQHSETRSGQLPTLKK